MDQFEAEYVPIRGLWLRHVKCSFNLANQTSVVYERLEHANSLTAHFGTGYANVTVSPGLAAVYVSALNRISSPSDYNEIKLNVGPLVVPTPLSLPATAPVVAGGQISAETLGKILSTKDDRKKKLGSRRAWSS